MRRKFCCVMRSRSYARSPMSKIFFFRRSRLICKLLSIICVAIFLYYVVLFANKSDGVSQADDDVRSLESGEPAEQSQKSQTLKALAKSTSGPNPSSIEIEPISSIIDALSSLQPPVRPVWTLIELYEKSSSHTVKDDLEIVSALSYCANNKDNLEFLRELRASGQAIPEQVAAIESSTVISQPLCVRLSDADFDRRSKVMRAWAEKGNAEAMLGFFEVGPPGGWKLEGHDENRSATVLAWRSEAIAHLERALDMGRVEAFATLAEIYRRRAEEDFIFQGVENAGRSYAYGYAYAMALRSSTTNEDVRSGLQNYVMKLGDGLSEKEKQESEIAAEKMLEECCNKLSLERHEK